MTVKKLALLSLVVIVFAACSDTPAEEQDNTKNAYISDVFEYVYAPGQHADLAHSTDRNNFIGEPTDIVYLGGFGGYIIAGFNHDVKNVDGFDFEVYGSGVDAEPAIVSVMSDDNGDGLPNEQWYELKGSEFDSSIRNYEICYRKAGSDENNITWTDNQGGSGELISGYNGKFTASWWWSETTTDSIVFKGTRLPDTYENINPEGAQHWKPKEGLVEWGYAENPRGTDYDNANKSNQFDIANAVDYLGNPVELPHIRFIKVQTSVLQQAGWLNEISAEVRGAKNLNFERQ